jgi:hypothetical protein
MRGKILKTIIIVILFLFGVGLLGFNGTEDRTSHRVTVRFVQSNEIDINQNASIEIHQPCPVEIGTYPESYQLNWKINKSGKVLSVMICHSDSVTKNHTDWLNLMCIQGSRRFYFNSQNDSFIHHEGKVIFTITDRD